MEKTRVCSNCKGLFPANLEHFNRKGDRGGLQSYCRPCQTRPRERREANPGGDLKDKLREVVGLLKEERRRVELLTKENHALRRERDKLKQSIIKLFD